MNPSVFTTQAAHIEATSCPAFDEGLTTTSVKAKEASLSEATAMQETRERRAVLGKQWANDLQDPMWETQMNAPHMFPAPPALIEPPEVIRLRGVLPAEFLTPVNESGLSLNGQLAMARALEQSLPAYGQYLAKHREPVAVHSQRLTQAFNATKSYGYPPQRKPDGPNLPSFGMIPSGTLNTLATKRRYFRVLVWNLENFTRDRRPRGSAPIESVRNQARIAIVTELMLAFDVDLLLVMETGKDVGGAMTAIATRIEKTAPGPYTLPHGIHPLVSPPTGALPSVKNVYSNINLGRRTSTKALALRTLFEVYDVTAKDRDLPLTEDQAFNAWVLLREVSSAAKTELPEWDAPDLLIRGESGRYFPAPAAIGELRFRLANVFMRAELNSDLPDMTYRLASDLAEYIALERNSRSFDLSEPLRREFFDDFCQGVQVLRELVELAQAEVRDAEVRSRIVGCSQGLEMLLLLYLQSVAGGIPEDDTGWIFSSSQATGGRFTLAAYLTAVTRSLRFDAIDKAAGPLNGDVDKDVVLSALERLGIVKWQIETYGMVYRPPSADALGRLFDIGVKAHGYRGGADETAAQYDIVRGNLRGGGFTIQQSGGLLNWRSALQITVPVNETLSVPFALFHTRYSGSAEISAKYKSELGLTSEESDVMARVETMVMMANALLPGNSRFGMPLIVGDFNIPSGYLDASPDNSPPVQRKQRIRQRLLHGMADSSYLRHTSTGRIGEGHPKTTLKAFGTLGLGELEGSQPYDGVYEPFDFAMRQAIVRSGVVKISAIITQKAFGQVIEGKAVRPKDAIDLDAHETQDTASDENADQPDADESAAPGQVEKVTVGQAAAFEVARIYAACARRLIARIVRMFPWFEHLAKSASRGRTTSKKYATGTPSPQLLQNIERLKLIGAKTLPELIERRQVWFAERVVMNDYFPYPDAGPFADCRRLFSEIAQQAEDCKIHSPTLEGLEDELEQIDTQLKNFETNSAVREAVAYRAIVSDHLPQIIELDLDPGP